VTNTIRTSERTQLEMELAEIRRILRRHEEYMSKRELAEGFTYLGAGRYEKDKRSRERQRAIEKRLLDALLDLAQPHPHPPLFAQAPATEHHGPETL